MKGIHKPQENIYDKMTVSRDAYITWICIYIPSYPAEYDKLFIPWINPGWADCWELSPGEPYIGFNFSEATSPQITLQGAIVRKCNLFWLGQSYNAWIQVAQLHYCS